MTKSATLQQVPARAGRAVALTAGEAIQIINTHGHQVVDFWAFKSDDTNEYLSMPHTRATLSRITPRVGDVLVDTQREPMLMFEEDTSPGVHDTLIAACDRYRYRKLGCQGDHASCADNMHSALRAQGLSVPLCPASFNLWMNIPFDPSGNVQWLPPVSKAGDRVTFRALVDCIAVLSACPQDILPINAGHPVSADFRVLPPRD